VSGYGGRERKDWPFKRQEGNNSKKGRNPRFTKKKKMGIKREGR